MPPKVLVLADIIRMEVAEDATVGLGDGKGAGDGMDSESAERIFLESFSLMKRNIIYIISLGNTTKLEE